MDKCLKEAIKDRDDEIARLKQMLAEAQRAGTTDEQAIKRRSALWGDRDIVSAETSEDDSGSDEGGRFVGADGGKEVITQRMPIGWCEPPPPNEPIEPSNLEEKEEDEEETSLECFTALAGSHIRQALISGLSSAMTNLSLDDLVVKLDPGPDEVTRALVVAFTDWAAERIASEQTTAVLNEPIKKFWRYVFQNFVRHDDEIQALLEGIEQRVGELEREERAGAKELAGKYQNVVVMLCKNDVVYGEAVVEWWQKGMVEPKAVSGACHWHRPDRSEPTETDLRAVMRRFVEWFQRDSSGDEDEDDDDDDDEESEEEIDSGDEEMQDPASFGDVCVCFREDPEGCVCGSGAWQEEGAAAQRKEKKSVRFEGESEL